MSRVRDPPNPLSILLPPPLSPPARRSATRCHRHLGQILFCFSWMRLSTGSLPHRRPPPTTTMLRTAVELLLLGWLAKTMFRAPSRPPAALERSVRASQNNASGDSSLSIALPATIPCPSVGCEGCVSDTNCGFCREWKNGSAALCVTRAYPPPHPLSPFTV